MFYVRHVYVVILLRVWQGYVYTHLGKTDITGRMIGIAIEHHTIF